MNVLVLGGTGFVGTRFVNELSERGHDVTALARSPGEADLPDGVATVAADVTDPDAVAAAVDGRDAVVNLVALSPLFEPSGGNELHERVHLGGTENAVEAAQAHGVERFVQMSALGADPDADTAYLRAKGAAERVVRDSGLDWTVVRPSVVFGDGGEFVPFTKLLTTPYVTGLPGGGATRFQPIWVGDLAPMLADCVAGDAHVGETYELAGPAVLTMADVARLAHLADGRPLTVLPVPMALARVGLTAAGAVPGVPFGADQYRSLRLDNTVAENDVTAFGVDPGDLATLESYLGVEGREPGAKTAGAALAGVGAWLGSLVALLVAGLATGAWQPSTVDAADVLDVGVLPALAAAVLVGVPVALYVRDRLVAPLALASLWFCYFGALGLTQGLGPVRGLYIGLLYGVFGSVLVPLAAVAEYALRRLVGRRRRPTGT